MRHHHVSIGQRFMCMAGRRRVWEVEDIYETTNNVVHVKLHDVDDYWTRCTLAEKALCDSRQYRRLPNTDFEDTEGAEPRRVAPRRTAHGRGEAWDPAAGPSQPKRMRIASRSSVGFVVACSRGGHEHRFLISDPDQAIECPTCGNRANSVPLLVDYLARERGAGTTTRGAA